MKFNTPKEMYDTIVCKIEDLYCPTEELYAFLYGGEDDNSICAYWVSPDEAIKLQALAKENDEYWGAFLGVGGSIYENNDEDRPTPMDFCEEYYDREWIKCSDVC